MTSASTTPETTASARKGLSRRGMLAGSAAAAGAFSFGFAIPFGQAQAQGAVPEINAWVVIHPDDKVVIRIARSEMGQGTLTGLAQLVAEELNCDWSKVTTEYPTPGQNVARNRIWGNFSTGGSRGIRESHEYVRKGGAAARTMLIQAAANEWKVPVGECTAEKSVITHKASGRSLRYGQVATAAAKLEAPKDIALKDPKDWTIAGKPLARLDTADKTTGAKIYGMDFKLPGMLNAAIKDCPVFGGKVKSFDAAKIKAMPGVKHVLPVGDSAVTVVADTWWQAKTALDALPIVWDEGPHTKVSSASLAEWLKEGLDAPQAVVGNQNGDVKAAIANAARTVEAVYSYPFQNHACMETMNATALYTPEKCEVWTPTQNGEAALAATAEASGLPIAKCEAYKIDLGGGFGRRGAVHDWVRQVVAIAKQIPGTPVKLIWSREEDMLHGRFHPLTQCKMVGALDKDGNLTGLHMRISGQSIVAGIFPQNIRDGRDPVVFQGLNASGPEASIGYSIPNLLIDHAMRNPHVPPGFWRGVNLNQNAIYLESFIDELANAAGKDPLEFRRALMKNHPKHLAVLNAAAEKAGWGKPLPAGVFRGICQTMGFGSYVAAVAEVSVSDDGKLKIHRIVAATDPGHVVNPAQVERQVEGSFVYGLSAALYGEITIKDGRVEQENFDTYEVMRLEAMPAVETVLLPSGGFWGGVGEPTIAVAAPAVLNAIFAATGKRIRNLPLKNADLKKA
ncbi:MAG TPA: molybdopterin cofactor-binding domain-containing protein [Bosea sp. (in: a-proteobacteria)]|jgi:isoquinoline 1-oxidoreductase beta subunit|uniref:xanthine dehydrogenase family protein molybdopterin-binding subunit n=1 Tax=Bosea sp. (in: a-proteobacteria) TaxID=1871050 RepID=UPI002DDD58A7|nr:molybdopterin cofactor-binding domain-containing protein [Bosea sp. (in: a-proteobacteria)]HEV2554613.1 molybdopterin cofactor-binding domain-containing protein [Bosea sp. (in: a-proteobacteria)]